MPEHVLSRRRAIGLVALGAVALPSLAHAAAPPRLPERATVRRPDGSTADLAFEEYLKGVLPTELGPTWPDEALKAQAVAARSYAAAYVATHGSICSTTSCQAWDGGRRHPRTDAAVDATGGQVLLHDGTIAWTFYSSTCGGHTSPGSGRAARYCQPVRCWVEPDGQRAKLDLRTEAAAAAFWAGPERPAAFCGRSPRFRHAARIDRAAAEAVLDRLLPAIASVSPRYQPGALGQLRAVEVAQRSLAGHALRVRVVGTGGTWEVTGETALRSILRVNPAAGPQPSTALVLGLESTGAEMAGLGLRGGGYGHGIGLCQYGARGMAERGQGYEAILRHYFSDVELARL